MAAGRPRTMSPSPEECIKLGQDLIKWVKVEDKENPRLLFTEFYSIEKKLIRNEWKAIIKTEEFRPYYEQAQAVLAKRCINGTMEKSFGQRYIRLYDRDLVEEENETAKYNAEVRKLEDNSKQPVNVYINDKLISDKCKSSP